MVAVPLIKASHDFLSITGPGWNDFGDGFAMAGDANGFAGLAHLLEQSEAFGFEFGNRDFDHGAAF